LEGEIIAVNGPVIDIYFPDDVPNVYEALELENPVKNEKLVLETRILLGDHRVRAIALGSTDGISRGLKVKRTFHPISVPVSEEVLGRVVNVFGEPIDGGDKIKGEMTPIIKNAVEFRRVEPSYSI